MYLGLINTTRKRKELTCTEYTEARLNSRFLLLVAVGHCRVLFMQAVPGLSPRRYCRQDVTVAKTLLPEQRHPFPQICRRASRSNPSDDLYKDSHLDRSDVPSGPSACNKQSPDLCSVFCKCLNRQSILRVLKGKLHINITSSVFGRWSLAVSYRVDATKGG
ncbi:uncharacterized protein TrAtP1_000033 [Trichoderma atroviride]|uniref:uncharacterized protein n=1 Tax=Hypocrea atroviridis TaxID=63577 RepID=UPI00332E7C77|nr:hypothetical protein TrAtP1_000033 [Trichoderma atroviride]